MFEGLQNPILSLALLLGAWGLWRVLRWLGSGGKLPLRGRRGTASSFASAAMAVQALYQPGVKHVIEQLAEQQSRREEDDDGDPPEPGVAPDREPRDGE